MKWFISTLFIFLVICCTSNVEYNSQYSTVKLEDCGITIKVSDTRLILPTLCNYRDTVEIQNKDTLQFPIADTEYVTLLCFDRDSVRLKSLTPMSECVISLWGSETYDEGCLTFTNKEGDYYIYSGNYNQWHRETINCLERVGFVYFPDPYRNDCFWMNSEEFKKYCKSFIDKL